MTLLAVFQHYPLLLPLICLVLGLLVGSFLNVVVYRLPLMMERQWRDHCEEFIKPSADPIKPPADKEPDLTPPDTSPTTSPATTSQEPFNLAVPRSRCPKCGHLITALENIPVLSYLFLRGKCRSCKTAISPRYPLVELCSGLLSGYIAYRYGFSLETLALLLLTWTLVSLTLIDFDHQLLPDTLTLPLLWLGLLLNTQALFTDLHSALWGAVAGYLSLWLVFWGFKLVTGKEGMGYGDFKLLAALGAWGGWQLLPLVVILSSFVGAVIGILLIVLRGRDRAQPIPFGPFLAIAGWIAMLWGDIISTWYLQMLAT